MQCTAQEIEEKRRSAQEKLLKRTHTSSINKSNLVNHVSGFSANKGVASPGKDPKQSSVVFSPKIPSRSYPNTPAKPYDKPKPVLNFYGKSNIITGNCALISDNRFVVELSGFSPIAIETFKTIPSKSYNPSTKFWDFNMSDYHLVQSKMALLKPDVVIGKLPNYVLNCCKMPKPNYSYIDLNSIDQELCNSLMPFQKEGVCFGIDKGGRCLIADDMGLGKTFQALAITSYFQHDFPVLIATTSSMKNTWEQTIREYMPSISVMQTQYMVSSKDYIGDAKILIVSHDLMSRCVEKLLERRFRILIVDESHALKSFKAKCTKAATALAKQAARVILLSGTPALSRPSELYTQLSLIDDTFFGNFIEFSKRYCDGKTTSFGWDASGKSNLQELEIILYKRFMIRRTKQDVLKMLPNKVQEVVRLDVKLDQFGLAERNSLNALLDNYSKQKGGREKYVALLMFFAESAKIKIPSVCSYILQTLEEDNKFIVFAHHRIMLDAIEKVLHSKKKKFIRIDGNTTSEQRKTYVDRFQLDENCQCALLSITAANAGITLTAATLVLFAELHWNPSILSQAESRAHRIGQTNQVVVKYLLADGTSDDHMWKLLAEKQKILCEAGLFQESFNNVAVSKQAGNVNVPESLLTNRTSNNTLDISTYFQTEPSRSNIDAEMADISIDVEFLNSEFDDIFFNQNLEESINQSNVVTDFFNDGLDDVLGNVVLNV